jgi:hypothetical protein
VREEKKQEEDEEEGIVVMQHSLRRYEGNFAYSPLVNVI